VIPSRGLRSKGRRDGLGSRWRELSVCGVTCLPAMEGQARAAVSAWTATSLATASRLSRVPRREGNSGSSGCPPRSFIHARRIFAAPGVSGVQRSLRPLPWQRR
jgi:hypothetical protein